LAGGIRDILNGDAFSYVDEFPAHAEERKQWFHVSAKPIIIEGKDCASVVYVDVTEAKLARVRAASLAQLVLESPDEVYVLAKTDICIVEVNYGACGNLGFDREQLLGKTPAILLTSESFERMLTAIQPLVDRDEQTLEFELVHRRVDGTEYTCSWSVHCGMFEEREVFFAFARDMTERKRLEMQLRQAQKLESVGQLAAGLAHEINTPMQAIFGNVEFLQNSFAKLISLSDRLVELLDQNEVDWSEESKNLAHLRELYRYDYLRAQTPQALNEASDASKRVISIVRAMKIMSHPGTQEKVSTNLSELIENAATITRNRWKYVAETKFDFSADPILIDALPDELIQVFINLFVNAADAIAEKIGESPRRLGWIEITTRLEGDKAFVSFRDTGQGIPKAIVNRVFDPFFTTKDVGKGTGQGLAIAFDVITKKHQGTITAVSDEGIGTTIDIVLPRNGSRGTHAVIYPVQHASSTLLA
jgi:PAS domain S-box-containing protein